MFLSSIAGTEELPALYAVPHKFRPESRSSSITFDLAEPEIRERSTR